MEMRNVEIRQDLCHRLSLRVASTHSSVALCSFSLSSLIRYHIPFGGDNQSGCCPASRPIHWQIISLGITSDICYGSVTVGIYRPARKCHPHRYLHKTENPRRRVDEIVFIAINGVFNVFAYRQRVLGKRLLKKGAKNEITLQDPDASEWVGET